MARSSYRVKRWLRNVVDWRNFLVYRQLGGDPSAGDRTLPIRLALSSGNELVPSDVANAPEWFLQADFDLLLSNGNTVSFVWNTDHWTTTGDFPGSEGSGTITQGANSYPARYSNAEYDGNFITAANSVRIVGANGVFITWSGN